MHNVRPVRLDEQAAMVQQLEALRIAPEAMTQIGCCHMLWVEQVDTASAEALGQALRSQGGEALLRGGPHDAPKTWQGLLLGTESSLRAALAVLGTLPYTQAQGLAAELGHALARLANPPLPSSLIGNRTFRWAERTYVMGIVNATPDSFSGDGLLRTDAGNADTWIDRAVAQALSYVEQGADLIDVGGESTRPGAAYVDADAEARRVVPVIKGLRARSPVPISIDTYKASVAQAALDAGADWVNDVWGLQMDPAMASMVADRGVPVVLMHNRAKPQDEASLARLAVAGRPVGHDYENLVTDILRELRQLVHHAEQAGIARERIVIDPGIGFGKTPDQNLVLLNHLDALRVLGLPILLGTSRKSFIGLTLDSPPEDRLEGTAASVALGIARGANIVRVHDVAAMTRVARMSDAVLQSR